VLYVPVVTLSCTDGIGFCGDVDDVGDVVSVGVRVIDVGVTVAGGAVVTCGITVGIGSVDCFICIHYGGCRVW